jgi:trk system potassium uptake protein TrkH
MPQIRRQFSPAQLLAVSVAGLIAAGTVLLWLPVASAREPLSLLDALFTSTSAVCVTGLIVVDTPNDLSVFGQSVVLLLIQAGGLGYMAITTVVAVTLGKPLTVHERLSLQEALHVQTMDGLVRFVLDVFKLTLVFELAGTLVLGLRWAGEMGIAQAFYHGLFHSVSAFNNAGFALFPDSLMQYRDDPIVNLTVMSLIVCGGLGFVVLTELGRWPRVRRLSVHTRLVLTMSAALVAGATVAIFALELRNPRTLGALTAPQGLLAAFFQAVSPRTAGFNTIDIGAMAPATLFLLMVLMFVGAAPGGTGGGIKVTTLGITVAALWATVRGARDPVIFRRRLPPDLVAQAFFISLIAFFAVNGVAALVLVAEGAQFLPVLFETVSAAGTVGLSTGEAATDLSLSGTFGPVGKLLIIVTMYMGRIGPLTLAIAVARGRTPPRVRHPEGRVLVG